jgi:hypothetical protein
MLAPGSHPHKTFGQRSSNHRFDPKPTPIPASLNQFDDALCLEELLNCRLREFETHWVKKLFNRELAAGKPLLMGIAE